MGVLDRIEVIRDLGPGFKEYSKKNDLHRPPYIYQVPLSFIPGLGKKAIEKLLNHFETEMNILHKVSFDDIDAVMGERVARNIIAARSGKMKMQEGGGRNIRKG